MANSLIEVSPSPLVGVTNPKFVLHPMIRPGTLFCYDFTDANCQPGGVITPGVKAIGTTFKDLTSLTGNVSALVSSGSTRVSVNSDGSIAIPGSGSAAVFVGSAGQFDMSAAPYESLFECWFKIPATGYTTSNYQTIAELSVSDSNHAQIAIDLGSGGLQPRCTVGGNNSGSIYAVAPGYTTPVTPGTPMHFAAHFNPTTGLVEFYGNGVLVASATLPAYPLWACPSAFLTLGGSAAIGTMYAAALHNLTLSQAQEAAQGYAASDILSAAQHVAASYAYGMGTLAGAPRTAYS